MIYYNVEVTQIAEQDYYGRLKPTVTKCFPTKYPICNDDFLRVWEIRFVPVNNYLLFYIVREDEKTVYVLRFLYSRRNWQKILRKQLEDEVFDLTTHYIQEETEKYGAK